MAVTRVTQRGFLQNLMGSIAGIPIGILLFLASFYVLFINEGRTNWSKVAAESVVVDANTASGHQGEFVSVTGPINTDSTVGDPDFVAPGNFITLSRNAEMYAWVEESHSETRDKVGGGTETVTTYTYELQWTSNPQDASQFEQPEGHSNPAMTVDSGSWSAPRATIGAWPLTTEAAAGQCFLGAACRGLPSGTTVNPSTLTLLGAASTGRAQGDHIYLGNANPTSPVVGDIRLSWSALPTGGTVTAFGGVDNGQLVPFTMGEESMLRVMSGDRAGAIQTLEREYKLKGRIFLIVGFLMMWIGMNMVFGPLQAIAGILPFVKKVTGFIIGAITLVIAVVLTTVTVLVSKVLHNWILASLVGIGLFGFIVWTLWKKRQPPEAAAPQVATATAAGFGPPPGPPPGFAPPGAPPSHFAPPGAPPSAPPGPPPAG